MRHNQRSLKRKLRKRVQLLKELEREHGFDARRRGQLREAQLMLSRTKHERVFADLLRRAEVEFREQKSFIFNENTIYVVDFVTNGSVVIEIDGSSHKKKAQAAHDAIRDAQLTEIGFRVVRIMNSEVYTLSVEDVKDLIFAGPPTCELDEQFARFNL